MVDPSLPPDHVRDWRDVVAKEKEILGVKGGRTGRRYPIYAGLSLSGGGYIGSWFAACRRYERPLQRWLDSGKENPAFSHLRQHSRYLSPQGGALSLDTLTMVGILLRNMLLNQGILLGFLALVLLLPLWVDLAVFEGFHDDAPHAGLLAVCAITSAVSTGLMAKWARAVGTNTGAGPWHIFGGFVIPMTVTAMIVSAIFSDYSPWIDTHGWPARFVAAIGFGASTMVLTVWSLDVQTPRFRRFWITALVGVLCGGAAALLCTGLTMLPDIPEFMPAIVVACAGLVTMLMIGLMGRELSDARREWWSRVGAMFAIISIAWAAVAWFAIRVPPLWREIVSTGGAVSMALVWIAIAIAAFKIASALASREDKTREDTSWTATAGSVAGLLFIGGMLAAVAVINDWAVTFAEQYWSLTPAVALFCVTAFQIITLTVFSLRFDINEFSLNHFYRNRLVRCYMGAARSARNTDPFTGLDFEDDWPIHTIAPWHNNYTGPFHIVCTALNLAKPSDLAMQDRMADSFVITPLYSGSRITGYRETIGYIYPQTSMKLGTAVAISGATASPAMGNLTSPLFAFLLTMFNVRLGWWVPHPESLTRLMAPAFSLFYILRELLAATTNKDKFLYLSDGGHFENLGAYELIRRRCRLVIIGDGECDGKYEFPALGALIRMCRLDFDVDIQIDTSQITPAAGSKFSQAHCAVGRINYPDGEPPGTLLYLKSSLTGDEPPDVLQYATTSHPFPHESTADQFFSEAQFESYRKLGEHVAGQALATAIEDWKLAEPRWADAINDRQRIAPLLLALQRVWFAPAKSARNFTRHTGELTKVWEAIRSSSFLGFLDAQIFPSWHDLARGAWLSPSDNQWLPSTERELREAFYLCQSLIQLMENVYVDLDLEHEGAHPDHRGWMNLFRHWTGSGMMRIAWALSCQTYGARFQSWCRRILGLTNSDGFEFDEGFGFANCNPVEQKLIKEQGDRHAPMKTASIVGINVIVSSILDERQFRFRVGLLAVSESEKNVTLEWIRIQDQLRSMGLGRAAVQQFADQVAAKAKKFEVRDGSAEGLDWLRRVAAERSGA